MTYTLDANVFITAWNNHYPMSVFPTLWECLDSDHIRQQIVFIKPVYNEIDPIPPHHQQWPAEKKQERYSLRTWLESRGYRVHDLNDQQEQKALDLENRYQTQENAKGASKIDIKLIAFAKNTNHTIVTFEAMQLAIPGNLSNYKIPLICQQQNIRCISFINFLQEIELVI